MVKQYYLKEYTVVAMNENLVKKFLVLNHGCRCKIKIPIRIIYQPAGVKIRIE